MDVYYGWERTNKDYRQRSMDSIRKGPAANPIPPKEDVPLRPGVGMCNGGGGGGTAHPGHNPGRAVGSSDLSLRGAPGGDASCGTGQPGHGNTRSTERCHVAGQTRSDHYPEKQQALERRWGGGGHKTVIVSRGIGEQIS